jgi:MFS family permease
MALKLTPIYTTQIISSFAGSILGIFIPVYLLTLGYPLQTVMVFFLIQDSAKLLATQVTGYLSARISLKLLMLSSIPIQIAFLALLGFSGQQPGILPMLAIMQGVNTALYWVPLLIYFTIGTTAEDTGRQVGAFRALPTLFGIAAPLLSGVIAAKLGFNWVFAAAAVMFALSAVPMSALPAYEAPLQFNLARFKHLFVQYRRYFWLEFVENVQEELDLVIWPLAVYLLVKNTVQVGFAGSLIAAGSALFTYLVGRSTDRSNKFLLLRTGAVAMLILWLWRLGTITPLSAFVVSALAGFAAMIKSVPFDAIIYGLARQDNTREFLMFREYPVAAARILVYGMGIAVASDITKLFWLSILAYLVFLLLPRPGRAAVIR